MRRVSQSYPVDVNVKAALRLIIDKTDFLVYQHIMRKIMHIVITLVIAFYAMIVVVQTASATTMTIEMVGMVTSDFETHDNCQGCEIDNDMAEHGPACDLVCTAPAVTLLSVSIGPVLNMPILQEQPLIDVLAIGRSDAPDPFPPRTFI